MNAAATEASPDARQVSKLGLDVGPDMVTYMQCSRDCVKLLDLEGRLLYMSHNGLCAMEIDDINAVLGQDWWALWPEEARETLKQAVALAAGGKLANFVADCPTAGGRQARWDVTVAGVANESDGVHRLVAVSTLTRDATRPISAM